MLLFFFLINIMGVVYGDLFGLMMFWFSILFIFLLVIFCWCIGNCLVGIFIGVWFCNFILWWIRFVWFICLFGLINIFEYWIKICLSLFFLFVDNLFEILDIRGFKWFGKFVVNSLWLFCLMFIDVWVFCW